MYHDSIINKITSYILRLTSYFTCLLLLCGLLRVIIRVNTVSQKSSVSPIFNCFRRMRKTASRAVDFWSICVRRVLVRACPRARWKGSTRPASRTVSRTVNVTALKNAATMGVASHANSLTSSMSVSRNFTKYVHSNCFLFSCMLVIISISEF